MRTTYIAKPGEVDRKWYVVDAKDVPMGRLAAVVASILRGKNKPTFIRTKHETKRMKRLVRIRQQLQESNMTLKNGETSENKPTFRRTKIPSN